MANLGAIKSLTVKNLWSKYSFDISFYERVTVLIGKNGSGKSTILNILNYLLSDAKNGQRIKYDFDELDLLFSNKSGIKISQNKIDFNKEIDNLLLSEEKLNQLFEKIQKKIKEDIKRNKNMSKHSLKSLQKENNLNKDTTEAINENFVYLSTFDMEIKEREVVQKNYSKPYIKTELDSLLDELINKFKLYQLKLKDKAELIQIEFDLILEKYALKSDEKSLKDLKKQLVQKNNRINEIYKEKDLFINKLNELFLSSKKSIKLDENNSILFYFNDNDKDTLSPFKLSSGEKQMLIIMLTVVLMENNHTILLMDEPEISLHVEWQQKFIDTLLELNDNLQLIIATHSPAMVSKGYRNNIIKLENFSIIEN